jgi:hypothetical protein
MRPVVRLLVCVPLLGCVLSLARGPVAGAAKWDPIDPKDLAATTPVVEKDADAEALLWDVRVTDEMNGRSLQTVFSHHLQIKIFTDRGREAQSRVDLPHVGSARIQDLEARTIRRDGSIVELKKADVFERTVAKAGGFKVQATSFALPSVETGGIVEFRWSEVHPGRITQNLRLAFSRDIPVRFARYRLASVSGAVLGMQGQAFQTDPTLKLTRDKNYTVVSMENVRADRDEPHAPSDWDLRPWMLIYFDFVHPKDPDEYWLERGRGLAAGFGQDVSPSSAVSRAVESLSLSAVSLDQKLAAIVAFCRTKLKRVDVDTATEADRKGFNGNKSATEALAAGRGTAGDVIGLFLEMAHAAGLDARLARVPSRNDVTFDRTLMVNQLLWNLIVAVRDGDRWLFLDPTNDHATDGHLAWAQELVPALVGDKDKLVWATTPAAPPEWSLSSRIATLRLSEDGTLEGDLTTEYGGHVGAALRETFDQLAPAERETSFKEALASRLPGAEVTEVSFGSIADPEKPYTARCHVKVAGYAQRTGSRLFIQPAVFEKGIPPEFPAAQRRHPIAFEYAWKDVDRVQIELPAGYRLESPGAPDPIVFGSFGRYAMSVAESADGHTVTITRESFIGGGQRLTYPANAYASVKQFFDGVAKADARALTLRKAAGEGGRP